MLEESKREVLKLIELYKNNECLWNMNSKLFRRTDIKANAYRKIAIEIKKDEEYVKKKIRGLRSTYTNERKKISNSKKSGCGSDEVKDSSLFYFEEMRFLDPCISYRKNSTNFESIVIDVVDNESTTKSTSLDGIIDLIEDEPIQNVVAASSAQTNKKKKGKDDLPMSINENIDNAIEKLLSMNADQEKSKYELFGEYVSSSLKDLSELEAAEVMAKMQGILTDAEIRKIKNNQKTFDVNAAPPSSQYKSADTFEDITYSHSTVLPNANKLPQKTTYTQDQKENLSPKVFKLTNQNSFHKTISPSSNIMKLIATSHQQKLNPTIKGIRLVPLITHQSQNKNTIDKVIYNADIGKE